jgi:hypothetical protein
MFGKIDGNRTEDERVEFEATGRSNYRSEALHERSRIVPKQRLSNFFNCEVTSCENSYWRLWLWQR